MTDPRRGSAMLIVVMLSTVTMGLWMMAFRSTDDAIATEAFHRDAPVYEARVVEALAHAGALLEDGKPRGSTFRYLFTGRDASGKWFTTVEIRRRSSDRFEVSARPASASEVRRLPRNPGSFL